MGKSKDRHSEPPQAQAIPEPENLSPQQERLAPGEWPVLRACWRLGPGATTPAIVRETQREVLHDYKHTQTLLRRLQKKGLLSVDQPSPRRSLWSPTYSREQTLRYEIGLFVRQVAGSDHQLIQLIRQALDDFEAAAGEPSAGDLALPRAIRVRLIDFLEAFLALNQYRGPLAAALGIPPLAVQVGTGSTLSSSIQLLGAVGGDTAAVALRVLGAIEALLADDDIPAYLKNELDALLASIGELAASPQPA